MKNITVIVRNLPLNTLRNAEALRMSVGLTLRDDKVTVLFLDDGVWNATPLDPNRIKGQSSEKEFKILNTLKCRLLADKEAAQERGISSFIDQVTPLERREIARIIADSDLVIPF